MDSTFKKLNFKNQDQVFVLNSPGSFQSNIDSIIQETEVKQSIDSVDKVEFVIAFGTTLREVNDLVNQIGPKLEKDATFWFCYPKGSSKKYTCDFNRDTGWNIMGQYDLEGVRQVAIDEDWSALRFRKIQYIKKFSRGEQMALSKKGKQRATQ